MTQGTLGVVLMHGKESTPGKSAGLKDIASKLESSGAKVAVPTMPWSSFESTHVSVTVEEVCNQIDAEIEKLRAKGAQRFVGGGGSHQTTDMTPSLQVAEWIKGLPAQ